ncbi:MAG: hypothetical protein ACE5FG_05155 [Myxococcota bacterium]
MTNPDEDAPPSREREDQGRRPGPLESLFQEAIRRALSVGLGGFFLTEEAVRRALAESVPQEWVEYLSRQSGEVRSELTDRLVSEFGSWLHSLDLGDLLRGLLEDFEFDVTISVKTRRRARDAAPVEVLRRRG